MMSQHDRTYESAGVNGQKVTIGEGPSEIASWLFPHEPEEDEQRAALREAIERMLDRRIAGERVAVAEEIEALLDTRTAQQRNAVTEEIEALLESRIAEAARSSAADNK
jgi:hypothetical protein